MRYVSVFLIMCSWVVACGAESDDDAESPSAAFERLDACDETDFMATPFIGPAFDPESGDLLEPLEPPYVVAATVGWVRTDDPSHGDRLGEASTMVGMEVFSYEGLLGATFGGSEVCGSARTLTLWSDEASMMAFVTGGAHGRAMQLVPDAVQAWGTTRWVEDRSDQGATWEQAREHLRAANLSR